MSEQIYAQLLALGREEHALCTDARWDDLAELNARREALMTRLPAVAPAWALPDLREAVRLQALSAAVIRQGMIETATELRALKTGRTAAAGYQSGTGVPQRLPSFSSAA
jgi:hypothetical protein